MLNQFCFQTEMGILVGVVDAHGPAKDDEPVVAIQSRPRLGFTRKVDAVDMNSSPSQQRIQGSQPFVSDMLEDEKFLRLQL